MNIKQQANDLVHLLDNRRQNVLSRANRRIWRARRVVADRSLQTRVQALDTLDAWTEPLADKKVVGALAQFVDARREAVTDPGLDGYDERTAKDIASAVRGLDDLGQLQRIAKYEAAHKARKTVLGAVDKRLVQLEPAVVTWQEWKLGGTDDLEGAAAH